GRRDVQRRRIQRVDALLDGQDVYDLDVGDHQDEKEDGAERTVQPPAIAAGVRGTSARRKRSGCGGELRARWPLPAGFVSCRWTRPAETTLGKITHRIGRAPGSGATTSRGDASYLFRSGAPYLFRSGAPSLFRHGAPSSPRHGAPSPPPLP